MRDRRSAGLPLAKLGPSPGFDSLTWPTPVHPGDTVTFENEIIATKESRSMPGWGLLSMQVTGRKQDGAVVLSFVGHVFVERRDAPAKAG